MYNPCNILAAASFALLALATAPSMADEMKTGAMQSGTMSASPMSSNQMATGTMSAGTMAPSPIAADPMKADCLDKAGMETDAAKKEAAIAACDLMGGAMMQSGQVAPAK